MSVLVAHPIGMLRGHAANAPPLKEKGPQFPLLLVTQKGRSGGFAVVVKDVHAVECVFGSHILSQLINSLPVVTNQAQNVPGETCILCVLCHPIYSER